MLGIFITLFTFVLILVSLFMMLVILMQRANTNAGMGAAFGGGVADSTFGAETSNVLSKATRWAAVAYFLIAAGLYLMYIVHVRDAGEAEEGLPIIEPESSMQVPVEADPALNGFDGLRPLEDGE